MSRRRHVGAGVPGSVIAGRSREDRRVEVELPVGLLEVVRGRATCRPAGPPAPFIMSPAWSGRSSSPACPAHCTRTTATLCTPEPPPSRARPPASARRPVSWTAVSESARRASRPASCPRGAPACPASTQTSAGARTRTWVGALDERPLPRRRRRRRDRRARRPAAHCAARAPGRCRGSRWRATGERAARGSQPRPRTEIASSSSTSLPLASLRASARRHYPRSCRLALRDRHAADHERAADQQPGRHGLVERERPDRHGERRHEVEIGHRARGLEPAQRDAPGHVAAERGAEAERGERDPARPRRARRSGRRRRRSRTAGTSASRRCRRRPSAQAGRSDAAAACRGCCRPRTRAARRARAAGRAGRPARARRRFPAPRRRPRPRTRARCRRGGAAHTTRARPRARARASTPARARRSARRRRTPSCARRR